jgi:catalase (peroxidase I)
MLPTDVALLTDKKMVPWVELYANDKERWEKDFATAFTKLQELGVKSFHEG